MKALIEQAPAFSLFWENSKLNRRNAHKLGWRVEADAQALHPVPQLLYPNEVLKLNKPKDRLSRQMLRRESLRSFSEKAISERQLASLCFAFSQKDAGTRVPPSGGGKYPLEVFIFLFNVKSSLNHKTVYYNADAHSLSSLGDAPDWEQSREIFGGPIEGCPAAYFVFAAFPERTVVKYGERGGRFILVETGHYAQNLALRLVQEKLIGVASGGTHDEAIKKLLGLERTEALITLGYACGNR